MLGCMAQKYAYVPGELKMNEKVSPWERLLESRVLLPSEEVMVWGAESLFFQVTVVPALTVSVDGEYLKPDMATATGAGAVSVVVVLIGVFSSNGGCTGGVFSITGGCGGGVVSVTSACFVGVFSIAVGAGSMSSMRSVGSGDDEQPMRKILNARVRNNRDIRTL